jgi:nucleotidyltransferase/DNA polymerase involved in DNA repair
VWTEPILHVDMDSFFVEVERLDHPELRGRAVAVGGAGPRGVIASASYEARARGVRSAQPTSTARRLCPELVVVAPSHGRYGDVSAEVFAIFRSFTPLVEGLSLDEAFLDVRGLRLHFESPMTVAVEVRHRIRVELGLPASVGVAAVKFVAKLASETAKPDGLRLVTTAEQPAFLEALPATALWGVGPATLAALARLGVETVGDIAGLPVSALVSAVGPSAGKHLHDLANGIDPRPVVADIAAKSVSVEETYESDLPTLDLVETALLAHAQHLSDRLRRSGLRARTVTLKVRWQDFTTVTRSETAAPAVDGARDLYRIARDLMAGVGVASPVRLLGLSGTSLEPAGEPAQLGMSTDGGWVRVEDAVADIRARYGMGAVGPARLVGPDPPGGDEDQRKNPDA